MTTRSKVVELKEAGIKPVEIAKQVGVTKQRVSQILNPKPKKNIPLEMKQVLTPQEVTWLLGIHVNTVRRWSNDGRLRSFRIGNRGDRRFLRSDVDKFIHSV